MDSNNRINSSSNKSGDSGLMKRRVLMTLAGIIICGLSVGFFTHSSLGLDPFQVFAHGTWTLTPLGYGTYYMLLCAAFLVVIFFWNRKKIGLGTVLNLFGVGYMAELMGWILTKLDPSPSLPVRFLSLVVGIVVMCFAASLYFTADLGVSIYDAIALTISERHPRLQFRFIRIATDSICVLIGWLLGANVGIGTLITAFFMGPLIAWFNKTVAIPLLNSGGENKSAR